MKSETNEIKVPYDLVIGLSNLKEVAKKLEQDIKRDTQDKNDYIQWVEDIGNLSIDLVAKIEEFEGEYMNKTQGADENDEGSEGKEGSKKK